MKVVLDTNVLVSAIMSSTNACRAVLGMAFDQAITPLVGNALFAEYEDVFARDYIFERGPFDRDKRQMFLDDILSTCHWVNVSYLWRPNLRDEGDNHVFELAVAGGAQVIVTQNIKDFRVMEIRMPQVRVLSPPEFLHEWRNGQWQH